MFYQVLHVYERVAIEYLDRRHAIVLEELVQSQTRGRAGDSEILFRCRAAQGVEHPSEVAGQHAGFRTYLIGSARRATAVAVAAAQLFASAPLHR